MKTRGQFYLISAIIIVSLIIGFAAVSNYLTRTESTELQDFAEELEIESQHVLDYATKNGFSERDTLSDFFNQYVDYVAQTSNKNLYFIYGNKAEGFLLGQWTPQEGKEVNIIGGTETIVVEIGDVEYEFEITEGENFYYVVTQEIEGEYHVVAS